MSEPERFLTRWSRRKREADEAAPERQPSEQPAPSVPADREAATDSGAAPPKAAEADAPELDLSALPSLESITATTDIRAFLLPGVPAELTRAALRRAWAANPAIRDFIGLAENAWDFTAPDTVPGFGSSVPADVARRLIAGMLGEEKAEPPTEAGAPTETVTKPDVSTTGNADTEATTAVERPVTDEVAATVENRNVDVAMHKEEAPREDAARPARAHGGALPR
jgi:hypothetical protein